MAPGSRSGSPLTSLFYLYLLAATIISPLVGAACVKDADQKVINKLFSEGGPSTKIQLCPSTTLSLTGPIIFTAKDQELSTEGYPEDEEKMGRLVLVGGVGGTVVQGDCRRCARVSLRNLIINGSRTHLGRLLDPSLSALTVEHSGALRSFSDEELEDDGGDDVGDGGDGIGGEEGKRAGEKRGAVGGGVGAAVGESPLVLLGNNEGQVVDRCRILDPRGWVAIQVREGDNLSCREAKITNNIIGPAGEEWVEAVDGEDPDTSPLGRPLALGLSLACRESIVTGNQFIDITDASLIVYGSPGSLIEGNTISALQRTQIAGILLSDVAPFDGNYTNTRIINNIISADEGALIRVGIGLGASILSDDTDSILYGGVVKKNIFKGYGMGYGLAAAGLKDFVVMENESVARHGGRLGERCYVPLEKGDPLAKGMSEEQRERGVIRNPRSMAFLRNSKTIEGGRWQSDFIDAEFFYLVCLDPEREDGFGYTAKPVPKAKPLLIADTSEDDAEVDELFEKTASQPRKDKPRNSIMDRIISHSQARILDSIAALGAKVEVLVERGGVENVKAAARVAGNARLGMDEEGVEILASLAHLSARVATLETERRNTRETIDNFRRELVSLGQNLERAKNHDAGVLAELMDMFETESATGPIAGVADIAPRIAAAMADPAGITQWWLPIIYISVFQVVLYGVYLAFNTFYQPDRSRKRLE